MAITPSQWSHVLTIPESYTPSAATSGQTLVITESVIAKLSAPDQSTFWSNVQNGGGDVRICTDSGGINQLPVEIVSLDNAAETCVIWTRKPTYDGAGDLYVFIGKAGETQPPVTDPFGRNAVWSDYAGIYSLSDGTAIDSSGGNDLTTSGAPSVVSGKIGNATRFEYSADSFNGAFSGLGNTKRTLSLWVNPDDITKNRYLSTFNGGGKSNLTAMLLGFQSGQFNAFDEGYPTGSAVDTQMSATNSTWQHICYSWDGSRLKGYLNGSLVVDVADTLNPTTPDFLSITPASGGGSNFYTGNLQYFGARNSGIDPNEIATEYANQNDPAAFYGTPTIATTGGDGAVEQEVTATESQQAAQAETQSVIQTQQVSAIESQQLTQADAQSVSVTHVVTPSHPEQLNQSEQQAASVTQLLSSLDAEQLSESTQATVQLSQQIQHYEAQQNANAGTQAVTLSQTLQQIEVEQKAQAEQEIVQDGGGITANDAQQQSESEQQPITATQSVNLVEANQNAESVQATVTLAQQINAAEVDQFAQAQQAVITDGNGIVAVQVEQKPEAQVSEVTQTQQVSPVNVEQKSESEKVLPTIIQRLLAVEAEQITESPTLQVNDSDIIIDPQKISVERVTPTFTIQLVERPKYTIVRL